MTYFDLRGNTRSTIPEDSMITKILQDWVAWLFIILVPLPLIVFIILIICE